jgi:hypothetical protein
MPSLRAVLELSQLLDGLLRTHARGLVSSRSRVQGSSTFRGFDPSRSASRLVAGRYPHAVDARLLAVPCGPTATLERLDFEALFRARTRGSCRRD